MRSSFGKAELYMGFAEKDFQDATCRCVTLSLRHFSLGHWLASNEALAELEAIHGKAYKNYTEDHTKLFLTVQNKASSHTRCF